MTDNSGNEWMVFEVYPFISPRWEFEITEASDETMFRRIINPGSVKIQIINASIELDSAILQNRYRENLEILQENFKNTIELHKVDSLNHVIESNQMLWFANRNPISDLSYNDKVTRFGEKYNLLGLDYYTGGIYDGRPGVDGPADGSELVDSFDWRNRHGANDPSKSAFYYNNGPNTSGWLTAIEDQSEIPICDGLCYIYGPLAAIEGVANIYFNYPMKNYNLSEQDVLDCDIATSDCHGGFDFVTNIFARDSGIVDEACYPRDSTHGNCRQNSPPNGSAQNQLKIAGYHANYTYNTDTLKVALINHGPLDVSLSYYNGGSHIIALVGYGIVKAKDTLYDTSYPFDTIIVHDNSNYIGQLYWIFKNSWGTGYGAHGYFYHLANDVHIASATYYLLPIDDILSLTDTVVPYDKDKDGYWNWGISPEYNLPAGACSQREDSDDSENRIGPFDSHYNGTPVKPELKVYLSSGQSIEHMYVTNNSFFSFSTGDLINDHELHFYIENPGDAQLNLFPVGIIGEGRVEIIPVNGASENYDITLLPQRKVCMGDANEFIVTFTGLIQGELTKIKIFLYENGEVPDFEFVLLYNDCLPATELVTIRENQTWDIFGLKNKDYLITNGAILTVTGEIAMAENSDIFIDRGSKLVLDGGRLTSSCNTLWNGIDIWGNASMPQMTDYQGMVQIINGGTIEFADTAIATARQNGIYTIPSGGIISCRDAIFKDNVIDIMFYPFTNTHPITHEILPNFSRFTRSRFETTDALYEITRNIPNKHILMDEVGGIIIMGCTFGNYSTQKNDPRGKGIESYGAGYFISSECVQGNIIPCPELLPCRFENLEYGIRAFNSNSRYSITVNSADFIDNCRGIFMSLTYDATIIKNRFELNADEAYFEPGDTLIGIYTEYCTRYQIEENKITGSDPDYFNLVGMHILNSGSDYYNEIYNDSLIDLTYGIIAAGENRNKDGTKGLCIKCNDFIECSLDVYITPEGGFNHDFLGIATNQGFPGSAAPPGVDPNSMGAGNTFTADEYSSLDYNFYNNPDLDQINYTHQPNTFENKLRPSEYENIEPSEDIYVSYSKDTSCPSHFHSGGIQLESEKSILSNEKEILTAYSGTLTQYVDGGDTPGLTFEIQTSFPDDALDLRQQLLDESPYLSDTVMKSAIEKENVLLNAMVRDILVANPQAAKSADILNVLENKFDPMPDYLMEQILEGKSIMGEKEMLEREISSHYILKSNAFSNIVRYYKNDTLLNSSKDSVIAYLEDNYSPETHYQLAFCKLYTGDSTEVLDILNSILVDFSLTADQMNTHEFYEDLINILIPMQSDSVRIDSTTYPGLFSIMEESNEIPGIYSRNLLVINDLISYSEPVFLPTILKNKHITDKYFHNELIDYSYLNIYPNPAKSYLIIEYNLENFAKPAFININDAYGKKLYGLHIQDNQNQYLLDTRAYSPGIYLISLMSGNKILKKAKCLIIR
ncbi:MAG: T9SS type A sorting domain-containing protein [Bacteroidales bacterium]|nr:T9SS type A sorting domain-containing protein [Bacteroidales bacterium]